VPVCNQPLDRAELQLEIDFADPIRKEVRLLAGLRTLARIDVRKSAMPDVMLLSRPTPIDE
jgi:hypothetical protein